MNENTTFVCTFDKFKIHYLCANLNNIKSDIYYNHFSLFYKDSISLSYQECSNKKINAIDKELFDLMEKSTTNIVDCRSDNDLNEYIKKRNVANEYNIDEEWEYIKEIIKFKNNIYSTTTEQTNTIVNTTSKFISLDEYKTYDDESDEDESDDDETIETENKIVYYNETQDTSYLETASEYECSSQVSFSDNFIINDDTYEVYNDLKYENHNRIIKILSIIYVNSNEYIIYPRDKLSINVNRFCKHILDKSIHDLSNNPIMNDITHSSTEYKSFESLPFHIYQPILKDNYQFLHIDNAHFNIFYYLCDIYDDKKDHLRTLNTIKMIIQSQTNTKLKKHNDTINDMMFFYGYDKQTLFYYIQVLIYGIEPAVFVKYFPRNTKSEVEYPIIQKFIVVIKYMTKLMTEKYKNINTFFMNEYNIDKNDYTYIWSFIYKVYENKIKNAMLDFMYNIIPEIKFINKDKKKMYSAKNYVILDRCIAVTKEISSDVVRLMEKHVQKILGISFKIVNDYSNVNIGTSKPYEIDEEDFNKFIFRMDNNIFKIEDYIHDMVIPHETLTSETVSKIIFILYLHKMLYDEKTKRFYIKNKHCILKNVNDIKNDIRYNCRYGQYKRYFYYFMGKHSNHTRIFDNYFNIYKVDYIWDILKQNFMLYLNMIEKYTYHNTPKLIFKDVSIFYGTHHELLLEFGRNFEDNYFNINYFVLNELNYLPEFKELYKNMKSSFYPLDKFIKSKNMDVILNAYIKYVNLNTTFHIEQYVVINYIVKNFMR